LRQPKQRKPSVAAVNRAFASFENSISERFAKAVGASIQASLDAYHEAVVLPLEARVAALEKLSGVSEGETEQSGLAETVDEAA
jgi:hypothetical protein